MGTLNLLPLGEPDPDDIESAARLYLEYDRQGLLDDDCASTFAMSVADFEAVYARAVEMKREASGRQAPGGHLPVTPTPRPPDEQVLHDRVISAIQQTLRKKGRIAQTNPGPLRMMAVDGLYPDLVLTMVHERTDIVEAIYEVETRSTVEDEHARDEWVPFAGLGLMSFRRRGSTRPRRSSATSASR
jgi:hypothetical protein